MEIKDEKVVRLLSELFLKKTESPDWAVKVLERGFDSRSLRMLASMKTFDSPVEKDDFLGRSLRELNWDKININECLLSYSRIIAKDIIEDRLDPIEGAQEIYTIVTTLNYPSELQGWNMIDEGIWGFKRFLETGKTSYFFNTKKQLDSEILKLAKDLACS
jgi:hypothetical protein